MISLRSLAVLALTLPFAATASEPETQHGAPAQPGHGGDHAAPAPAPGSGPDCPRRLGNHAGAPRFSDYPAPRAIEARRYVAPRLSSREVRAYRSTLGAEVANGPNFAANYTIAAWGCGFSCSAAAIVNLGSGQAVFPAELRRISTRYVRDWVADRPLRYRGMRFRRDSQLLIVIGSATGSERDESAVYYNWDGTTLRHIRTIPRAQLCPA